MKAALLAILAIMTSLAHAAAQPQVRVAFEANGPVLVGQQVRVDITVLAPNFFLSSPQFPMFDIPGAVVTLPDENALNGTETIGGETYATIRRSYLITPQRAGDFVLPPAHITFRYAAEPGEPGVTAAVTLPPQMFVAKLPLGVQAGAPPVLVANIRVTQTLDGDPKAIKVGDALTRTISIFAADTQAMMIPPPTFEAPAGVRVYRRDPVLADLTGDHGGFTGGRRVDRVTYVFEKPGTYRLPAIEVRWFDAQKKRQEVSRVPAIEVSVARAPSPAASIAPPAPQQEGAAANAATRIAWRVGIVCLIGLVAAALAGLLSFRRFGPHVRAWLRARRQAQQASEPASFARLKYACFSGDPIAAYRALGGWARCQGFRSIQALCDSEPALRCEAAALERYLYGGVPASAMWNGRALFSAAATVRATSRARGLHRRRRPAALPALNP